jgi:murein DD-endopeptidase MepM/ murein hydrolase activator NlpD
MPVLKSKKLFFLVLSLFLVICGYSQKYNTYFYVPKKDTVNVYQEMLNDESDDLMEDHPADDIYNNLWTSDRVNPYKIPIDSIPDSVTIDCSKFQVPVPGYVTSQFGPRRYRYHYGIDLKLNVGDSVLCAFSGKVRIINYESRGYGNYIVVRHDNGLETVYAHLSQVLVSINQPVRCGELIALGGSTGRSTGAHLHFETRYLGNAINPANIINFDTGKVHSLEYLITKKNTFYYQQEASLLRHRSKAARFYKVRRGDTLSKIAARRGISVKQLCRLNGLKKFSHVKQGRKLRFR